VLITRSAQLISLLFHPMLVATIIFLVLPVFAPSALSPLSAKAIQTLVGIIFLLTFVVPAISLGVLRLTGLMVSMKMEERRERITPFVFITLYYGVAAWFFTFRYDLNPTFGVVLFSGTATIALLTLITLFWKISAHGAGMGVLVGTFAAFQITLTDSQLLGPLVVAVLLAGIVLSARLHLHAHTPKEVYGGVLLGMAVSFLGILIFT
jgi:membrane-associated phospholipid phosphatase